MQKLLLIVAMGGLVVGAYALGTAAVAQDAPAAEATEVKAESEKIDPAMEKDIRKLLGLMRIEQMVRQQTIRGMTRMKQAMPNVPADVWDKAFDKVDWGGIVDVQVPAYAKHVSHDDIKGLIAFYESPLGQRIIEAQPKIAEDVQPAAMAWGQKIGMQIMQELMAAQNATPQK